MRARHLLLAILLALGLVTGGFVLPSYAAITFSLSIPDSSVGINDDSRPDFSFTLSTSTPGTYTINWAVQTPDGFLTYLDAVISDVAFTADVAQTFSVDLTGLSAGDWVLYAEIYAGGVAVASTNKEEGAFTVDAVAPHVTVSKAGGVFYPVRDGYKDSVIVRWSGSSESAGLTVRNATNQVVATPCCGITQQDWKGNAGTTLAPEGVYTLELVIGSGDLQSKYAAGTVTVSHKRLVTKTFKKTVTAAGSLQNQSVGRCSTLKKNVRGWKGSIGLYTNTKCTGGLRASLTIAVHGLRMPKAISYGKLRITPYGGAATSAPRSLAYLDMRAKNGKWGDDDTRLGTRVDSYPGHERNAANYVWSDRFIVWAVYTAMGSRYDIKNFAVRLTYKILV